MSKHAPFFGRCTSEAENWKQQLRILAEVVVVKKLVDNWKINRLKNNLAAIFFNFKLF
jgi:hypothetical protein